MILSKFTIVYPSVHIHMFSCKFTTERGLGGKRTVDNSAHLWGREGKIILKMCKSVIKDVDIDSPQGGEYGWVGSTTDLLCLHS